MAETSEATLGNAGSVGGRLSGLRRDTHTGGAGEHPGGKPGTEVRTINGRKYTFRTAELTASKDTLDRQGNRVPIKEEAGAFTEETLKEVVDDISAELNNLVNMQSGNAEARATFAQFMDHPHYQLHKRFFERFTETKPGSSVGTQGRQVNVDKLKEWINSDRGLQDAYELALIRAQEMAVNSGVLVDMNRRIPQPRAIRNQDRRTGEGGWVREAGRWIKLKWSQEDMETYGRKTPKGPLRTKGHVGVTVGALTFLAGGVGAATMGPLGAVGLGSIPPAIAGIMDSSRRGERVTIEGSKNALNIARTDDPVKREWARRMYDLDVENLSINSRGQVVIRPDIIEQGLASPSMDPDTAVAKLVEEDRKIRALQAEMGVRREHRAGMDVSYLRPGHEQNLQRGIVSENDVLTALKRDLRMVDGDGNRCQVFFAGEWQDNSPDFYARNAAALTAMVPPIIGPFDRNTMDDIAAWRLRRELHRELIDERSEENWDIFRESNIDRPKNLRDKIDAAIAAEGDGKKSTEKIEKRLTRLGIDAASIPNLSKPFSDLEIRLSDLDTKAGAVTEILATITDVTKAPIAIANVDQAINDILSTLNPSTTRPRIKELIIDGVELTSVFDALKQIDNLVRDDMSTWDGTNPRPSMPPPLASTASDTEKAQYAADKAKHDTWPQQRKDYEIAIRGGDRVKGIQEEIQETKRILNGFRTNLRTAQTAEKQERDSLTKTSPDNTVGKDTNKAVDDMRSALDTVEGWLPPGPWTRAVIATQPADILLQLINQVNQANPSVGWPEGANGEKANREILLKAVAESRIDEPTTEYAEAIDPNKWGFTEYDLLLMSKTDLKSTMDQKSPRIPGTPAAPTVDKIQALKDLASLRFSQRREAFDELKSENEVRQRELENEKASISTEGGKSPELATIDKAASRYDAVRSAIYDLTPQELVDALDSSNATDVARFMPVEIGQSIAFANIQEWIFDHRNHDQDEVKFRGETGREAVFKRNSDLLTKDILRDLLTNRLNLVVPLPPGVAGPLVPPATFEDAIDVVRNQIQAENISPQEFAEALTEGVIFDFMEPRVERL